jgi:hypothetical protein
VSSIILLKVFNCPFERFTKKINHLKFLHKKIHISLYRFPPHSPCYEEIVVGYVRKRKGIYSLFFKSLTSPLLQSHSKINGIFKDCCKRKQHLAKCCASCLQVSQAVEIEDKRNYKFFEIVYLRGLHQLKRKRGYKCTQSLGTCSNNVPNHSSYTLGLNTTLSTTLHPVQHEWWMVNWKELASKELWTGRGNTLVFSWRDWKRSRKTSVRTPDILTDILTWHFHSTSLQR